MLARSFNLWLHPAWPSYVLSYAGAGSGCDGGALAVSCHGGSAPQIADRHRCSVSTWAVSHPLLNQLHDHAGRRILLLVDGRYTYCAVFDSWFVAISARIWLCKCTFCQTRDAVFATSFFSVPSPAKRWPDSHQETIHPSDGSAAK